MSPYRTTELLDLKPREVPSFIWLAGNRGVRASYVHTVIGGGDGDIGDACLVMQDGSTFAVSHDEVRYVAWLLGKTP